MWCVTAVAGFGQWGWRGGQSAASDKFPRELQRSHPADTGSTVEGKQIFTLLGSRCTVYFIQSSERLLIKDSWQTDWKALCDSCGILSSSWTNRPRDNSRVWRMISMVWGSCRQPLLKRGTLTTFAAWRRRRGRHLRCVRWIKKPHTIIYFSECVMGHLSQTHVFSEALSGPWRAPERPRGYEEEARSLQG